MKRKTLKRKVKRRMNNKNYKRKRKEKKSTRKYVGGSKEINFPCNIIQTEVNHDLKSVIPIQLNKSHSFNLNVARNKSGICDTLKRSDFLQNFDFFDDGQFVSHITQKNINNLKENYSKDDLYIRTRFTRQSNGIRGASTIFKPKPYSRSLFQLFNLVNDHSQVDDDEWIDIFFIIDTGDNLVKALKSMIPRRKYRFHIIHSVFSLGDSARKTLPNSSSYNCYNPNVRLYSWLFSEYPKVNPRDSIFMTSYTIKCSILSQPGFKVYQRWEIDDEEDGTTTVEHETWDSKKDHNNTNVKAEISRQFSVNDRDNHLSIQKKRSGDHFQIWFARRFPRYMSSRYNMDLQYASHAIPPDFLNNLQEGKSTKYFHEKTYFLTGDWPAFSYSLYNKINTIMFAKHPRDQEQTGFLSVAFNQ